MKHNVMTTGPSTGLTVQAEIPQGMVELFTSVAELEGRVSSLLQKIGPVTRPHPTNLAEDCPNGCVTELGSQLHNAKLRIRTLADDVNRAIDNIEL